MPKPPITEVIDTMYQMYADYPETELIYDTPFQLLLSVILSAQTTDKQVNKATAKLYHIVKEPQDILNLGSDQLGEYIRTVGLWTSKRDNIMKTAQMLVERSALSHGGHSKCGAIAQSNHTSTSSAGQDTHIGSLPHGQTFRHSPQHMHHHHGYAIPDTIEGITKLPGVGIKTAKVVLAVLYGQARIAVDTHVHRVSKRLGRIRGDITPNTTSKRLEKKIPNEYKWKAHRSIIYFGRYHCTAKSPNCTTCPFKDWCPEGKKRLKDKSGIKK